MNNMFSLHRFAKLLRYDLVTNAPKFFTTFLYLCLLVPFFGVIDFVFNGSITLTLSHNEREFIYASIIIVGTFISPMIIYKHINHYKNGITFISLPASALEKFLSMVVVCCFIVPVSFLVANACLDFLLSSTIFANVYSGHITISDLIKGDDVVVLYYLMGFALFCNMFFSTNKISKTFLSVICIIFLLTTITGVIGLNNIENGIVEEIVASLFDFHEIDFDDINQRYTFIYQRFKFIKEVVISLCTILLFVLTYFRIKKLQLK